MSKYGDLIKKNPNIKLAFGVECAAGWYDLIEQCTNDITAAAKAAKVKTPTVVQIKEKFGGLRYYVQGVNEQISEQVYAIIDKAEADSYKICEICGKPGTVRNTGWVETRCDEHTKAE